MFFHATQRRHKIRGDTFIRNNLGLTPLTLAAKLGRKEMFHEILEYQSMVRNRVFSHDVTAAILLSQNNETVAMLVYQTNPVGVEFICYITVFLLSKFAWLLAT